VVHSIHKQTDGRTDKQNKRRDNRNNAKYMIMTYLRDEMLLLLLLLLMQTSTQRSRQRADCQEATSNDISWRHVGRNIVQRRQFTAFYVVSSWRRGQIWTTHVAAARCRFKKCTIFCGNTVKVSNKKLSYCSETARRSLLSKVHLIFKNTSKIGYCHVKMFLIYAFRNKFPTLTLTDLEWPWTHRPVEGHADENALLYEWI